MSLDRLNNKVRTFLLKVPSHDCIVVVHDFLYPCHENAAKNSSWYISGVKQLFKTISSYIKFCKVNTLSVCGTFYFHDAIAELSHQSAMENHTVQCCRYATVLDMLLIFLYLLSNPPGLSIWCRAVPSTGTLNKAQFINHTHEIFSAGTFSWDLQIINIIIIGHTLF